jgi:hypothetical protein
LAIDIDFGEGLEEEILQSQIGTLEEKMKGRWFLVPGGIFIVLMIYFGGKYNSRKWLESYIEFDSTNINGRLERVEYGNKSLIFKVDNNKEWFGSSPLTGPLNDDEIFEKFAKAGDTIIKPAHSDTLRLKKKGKDYLYTFNNPK